METKTGSSLLSSPSPAPADTRHADFFLGSTNVSLSAAQQALRSKSQPAPRPNPQVVEAQVAQIWRDVLDIETIEPGSHFFDLGGQSALAVRTLLRIERALGYQADVTTLFKAPTLRAFVEALIGEQAPRQTPRASTLPPSRPRSVGGIDQVVEIQGSGHKAPVFVLNNTAVLFPLARALGDERPVYALQLCPATTPIELPPRDFRDLARDVVDLIRSTRPHGPYVLMGLCVFGALALEAAQQLRAAGETVELVVLNDTWAPGHVESLSERRQRRRKILKRAHNVSLDLRRVANGQARLSEFLAAFTILRRFGAVDAGIRLGLLDPDATETVMRAENRWYTDYLLNARQRYQPGDYAGDVLVFRCEETLNGRYFDDTLGWRTIVRGRLHVMDCPGMHAEMYLPAGSAAIARGIRIMLDDV